MIKTAIKAATITAMVLLDDIRPKPMSRVEQFSVPLPEVDISSASAELVNIKKVTKPRKKHICRWTDEDVWGAVIFALLVGLFIGICI